MTQSTARDSNESTTHSPSRRTIVAGAAWTIPVIAFAATAPGAAASTDGCVDLTGQAGWTWAWDNPQQMLPRADGGLFWSGDMFVANGDNSLVSNATTPILVGRLIWQIPVVAGQTYEITYQVRTSGANAAWAKSQMRTRLGTNDTTDTSRDTTLHTYTSTGAPAVWETRTITHVATTTGNVQLSFTFVMPPRPTNNGGQDDWFLRFPGCTA